MDASTVLAFQKAILAGLSCALSSFILNPIDVTKTRMMIQDSKTPVNVGNSSAIPRYSSFLDGLFSIYKIEGLRGWGRGLEPSMLREITYSSCRMGAYEPIKNILLRLSSSTDSSGSRSSENKGDISPFVKFGSALLSGGTGAAFTNPFDLVKTRFQAVFPGQTPLPYTNTWQALLYIYKNEGGLRGIYKAWEVTCGRAAFLTSGQLGTYDVFKNNIMIKRFGLNEKQDKALLHICSAMSASVVATTASNPCDVIKSRYMSDMIDGKRKYHSLTHCITETYRIDGYKGFLRGWTAAYWRVGPHTVMSLLLFEKARELCGFDSI